MHPLNAAAHSLQAVLTSVASVNPTFMETPDKAVALVELARAAAQLDELRLRLLASAGDVAHDSAARDAGAWLSTATRVRRADAAAELRLAALLDARLDVLAAGMREGRVSIQQAHVIARALEQLPDGVDADVRRRAEVALVRHAEIFDPRALAQLGRRILEVVAPEEAEAAEARALADLEASAARRQRLTMRAAGDGTTRLSAVLPDAVAARLATYLHAFSNPRLAPEPTERLPFPRRAAQAFGELLEAVDPDRLPVHGGDATTVVVTVSLESRRADLGTATIVNGVPGDGLDRITAAQARRLACTAHIVPAALGVRPTSPTRSCSARTTITGRTRTGTAPNASPTATSGSIASDGRRRPAMSRE